jgi:hypothetical protein
VLARTYKQLNAPFGQFAMATLKASTKALASNDSGDATYTSIEGKIQSLTTRRDALAAEIKGALNGAEFKGQPINTLTALSLILRGNILLAEANHLPH